MPALFVDMWGGGDGWVCRWTPPARLVFGILMLGVALAVPLVSGWGVASVLGVGAVWALGCGLPGRRLAGVLILAAWLFLPLFLLMSLAGVRDISGGWTGALHVSAVVALRGTVCLVVAAATMAALDVSEFRRGLSGLPLPHAVRALLLQIVHQTALLTDESCRIAVALRVRGAVSAPWRCRMRAVFAFPVIWLLRLVARAERVGAAMEVRGFAEKPGAAGTAETVPPPAPVSEPALVLEEVSVRYRTDGPDVLTGVSLRIASKERVALLGLNGAGKTTVLHAAAGLVPFSGRVVVDGISLASGSAARVRDRIGFLFGTPEDQILFPRVLDDVAFSLERRGLSAEDARKGAMEILTALGIEAYASCSPHTLSQGQRQRVALAGALVARPPLLLLDEPSASLDPVGKEELALLLENHEGALLLATHDLPFARQVCRRFLFLDGGRIVGDTPDPEAFQRNAPFWGQTVYFKSAARMPAFRERDSPESKRS